MRIRAAVLLLLSFLIIGPVSAQASPELDSVQAAQEADGSTRITLQFIGSLPETRILRSGEHSVHVVLVGAKMPPNATYGLDKVGEVESGSFHGFAGIGIRMDLDTLDSYVKIATRRIPSQHRIELTVRQVKVSNENDATQRAQTETSAYIPLSFADVSEVAGLLVKGVTIPSLDTFTPRSPFAASTQQSGGGSSSSYSSSSGPQNMAPSLVTIPADTILGKDTQQGVRVDEHIAVDRRLNALVVTGTPQEIAQVRQVVDFVDKPARSILLETQIVELTQTAARDLGIDYSPNGSLATATVTAASHTGINGSATLNAQLNALEEHGQAKILAQPRILALNAHPSAILSGEAVPIFNNLLVPSGSGTIVQQQIQYINVGVSLEILPRVSADGRVTTQIFSEVSSIIDYVQTAPRIAVRQGLASAIVGDGQSLVVGGLLQQNEITEMRKVPLLGDLPLIGEFFKNNSTSSTTTNLYIVVTPHVLANHT